MVEIRQLDSDRLSTFRTRHQFAHYAEFTTVDEYLELRHWAAEHDLPIFILGNGSNTLFTRRRIRTLVLRNRLDRWMNVLDDRRVEVSSSLPITTILKHCETHSLDSCYYLASVPATVGGALAMNAGRGRQFNMTIYDFVETITYLDGEQLVTLKGEEVQRDYRQTMFTGVQEKLIVSCVLKFTPVDEIQDYIRQRVEWSHREQDHSAPNCGSVFSECHFGILRRLKGFRLDGARYSPKTNNWLLNNSPHSRYLVWLVRLAQLLHQLLRKKCKVELIEVD